MRVLEASQPECKETYEALRGQWWSERKDLFKGALVDPTLGPQEAERMLSAREKWVCKKGTWYHCRLCNSRAPIPSLALFLRAVVNAVRAKEGARKLKGGDSPSKTLWQKFVDAEVAYAERLARASKNPVKKLDFKQLAQIRTDAAAVREALIVPGSENDEEDVETKGASERPYVEGSSLDAGVSALADTPCGERHERGGYEREESTALQKRAAEGSSASAEPPALSALPEATQLRQCTRFTAAERAVLEAVLDTGSARPPAGMSAEGFADRVNERLMETVGDTVLEVSAGEVVLVEDYAEELKAFLAGENLSA